MDTAKRIKDEQLKAIGDRQRLALLRRLMAAPATLSQLGEGIGKHPAWIRHHVKHLEAAGLVELAETRKTRNYVEKFYRATAPAYSLQLMIVGDYEGHKPVVAVGSHDLALELLMSPAGPCHEMLPLAVGSLDGLVMLRQGLADIAGCHLLDADSGEYNLPYIKHLLPDKPVVVVTLAERQQGMIVARGNPLGLKGVEDLARGPVRIVNRNPGSGTRLWLDRRLRQLEISPGQLNGYEKVVATHTDVAALVEQGLADAGLGIQAAAEQRHLGFIPLFQERYDLVIPSEHYSEPAMQPLLARLDASSFKKTVRSLGGYNTDCTGHEERLVV